jgi:hypothetical protein
MPRGCGGSLDSRTDVFGLPDRLNRSASSARRNYVASVYVKPFVLHLITGVGMGIVARWVPVVERGGLSPIPFFSIMGGSLVFLFLPAPAISPSPTCTIRRCWLAVPDAAGLATAGRASLSSVGDRAESGNGPRCTQPAAVVRAARVKTVAHCAARVVHHPGPSRVHQAKDYSSARQAACARKLP